MAKAMTDSSSCEVAFYEAFEEEELFLRKLLPSGHKYFFTWKTIQESGHLLPPARVISTRTQSQFPMEWAAHLDGILTRSTGYDHVSAYLKKTGARLKAAYLPDYAARAVAEQALMLWMALIRNLTLQRESFTSFHRDGLSGGEVHGRTMLVIGVGRIGSQVLDIAHGLGMKVLGVDIVPRRELTEKYGLRYLSIEEGLPLADIAVCAVPLTELTIHWLDKKLLSGVKKGAIFINIARGEIFSPCLRRGGLLAWGWMFMTASGSWLLSFAEEIRWTRCLLLRRRLLRQPYV